MKRNRVENILRWLRIAVATLIFGLLTLHLLDLTTLMPDCMSVLTKIQFIPALLAGSISIVAIIIFATLVFGRIYCSIICPLGILQDIVASISRLVKAKEYKYLKPLNILRWGVVAVGVIAFIGGFMVVVTILDPMAAYDGIATNIFRPIIVIAKNYFSLLNSTLGEQAIAEQAQMVISRAPLIIAVVTLLMVSIMAWGWGRLFCNTICLVGTVLGFFSRFAIFKIRLNQSKCSDCKECVAKCKSSCIDLKNHSIDYSRCVVCFNCLDECDADAMEYTNTGKREKVKDSEEGKVIILTKEQRVQENDDGNSVNSKTDTAHNGSLSAHSTESV